MDAEPPFWLGVAVIGCDELLVLIFQAFNSPASILVFGSYTLVPEVNRVVCLGLSGGSGEILLPIDIAPKLGYTESDKARVVLTRDSGKPLNSFMGREAIRCAIFL